MAETPAPPPARPLARARRLQRAWRILLHLGQRLYAVALISLILWLSWLALRYLVVSLILPSPPPAQVVELPRRLDGTLLTRAGTEFAGIAATEAPRLPPGHYHRFGPWIQPDTFNDCTRSGCHAPLPHNRRKEDRAFLNMHATSLHCSVCHIAADRHPLPLLWYDLRSGSACEPPAILQALGWLQQVESRPAGPFSKQDQRRIVDLLRRAVDQGGGHELALLADHLSAVRPASEDFTRLLEAARRAVPRHFRGEYGARLALRDPGGDRPLRMSAQARSAAQRFLERGDSLDPAERQDLLDQIHALRREPTLTCTQCHTRDAPLIDLARAGYPPQRVDDLVRPLVMQAIEHIMQGRPFYMPQFLPPRDGTPPPPPESAPDG